MSPVRTAKLTTAYAPPICLIIRRKEIQPENRYLVYHRVIAGLAALAYTRGVLVEYIDHLGLTGCQFKIFEAGKFTARRITYAENYFIAPR